MHRSTVRRVRRLGCSAVWLFGGSVVWLFGGSAVRLFGCSAVRRLGSEGAKIEENEVWRGRKSRKILVWRGLVGSWGSGGRFGWNFQQSLAARWSKMDQFGFKLAASCASWDQVGSKLRPRVAKMLPRWPAWSLCSFFWYDF